MHPPQRREISMCVCVCLSSAELKMFWHINENLTLVISRVWFWEITSINKDSLWANKKALDYREGAHWIKCNTSECLAKESINTVVQWVDELSIWKDERVTIRSKERSGQQGGSDDKQKQRKDKGRAVTLVTLWYEIDSFLKVKFDTIEKLEPGRLINVDLSDLSNSEKYDKSR